MNGRLLFAALCGIVVAACSFAPAEAAIQYRYAFYASEGGAATTSTFYVDSGQTVKVFVYLEEYATDSSQTSILKSHNGLVYAGVKITFQDPTASGRATVADASDIGLNPNFDDGLVPKQAKVFAEGDLAAPDNHVAVLWDSRFGTGESYFDPAWVDLPTSAAPNKVYLGWFAFTGGAVGVETGFSAGDPNIPGNLDPSGIDDIVTKDGSLVLDSFLFAGAPTAQGEIVTTPEPATGLIWIGLTSLFALTGRIRRKGSGVCDRS